MENQEQDSTLSGQMQEILDQMARMQAELDKLKVRARTLPQPVSEPKPAVSTTRRKPLKRLGLALLGGAAAATVTGFSVSEAKVISTTKPLGTSTSVAGAIVIPPGVQAPTGNPPNDSQVYYGLIASGDSTPLDLNKLPGLNTGVYGTGNSFGVYGSSSYSGVYGLGDFGVYGNGIAHGVYGVGTANGVYGNGNIGIEAEGNSIGIKATSSSYGVLANGTNKGVFAGGKAGGVFASSSNVSGELPGSNKVGVLGLAGKDLNLAGFGSGQNFTIGVYGLAPVATNSYAGFFEGNVLVNSTLSKAGGNFKIDHPLDPANKFLYHSFVESPDMKNIYDGVVTLDGQGEAVVEIPEWFEALNSEFRYQLTPLDSTSPNLHIGSRLKEQKFKIAGGLPGQEISWQVTGIRQDEWAKAHRISVEEDKTGDERGKYLHPELFCQPNEMAVNPRPAATKGN